MSRFFRENIYIAISWFLFYISNLYISYHTPFRYHPSRFSIISAFIPVLILSCGRLFSCFFLPFIYAVVSFSICIVISYGLITSPVIIAIMTVETSTALSMIKAQGLPIIFVILTAVGLGVWQGRRYGAYRPFLATISVLVLTTGVGYSFWSSYRESRFVSGVEAKYVDFMMRTPGIIGNTVYATYIYTHQKDTEVHLHTKVPREIIGHDGVKEKNIVLVVGETAFVGRHSVYGYKEQITTPNIQELKDNNYMCIIKDIHSSANLTREAVPTILSFYGAERKEALYSEKNLIELAKDQGYHTYWIGAQEGRGIYARPYGYISEFSDYFVRPDYKNGGVLISENDDNTLLPVFEDKVSNKGINNFYVIHLHGSHLDYKDGYDREDKIALPKADDYDRTIHKTDRVLKRIIEIAKKGLGDFSFVYIPDHGEVINRGHALQYGGYDQYRVPLYIKNNNCDDMEKLRGGDGYINDLSVRSFIVKMMGYKLSDVYLSYIHDNDFVIHSDGRIYSYDKIPH